MNERVEITLSVDGQTHTLQVDPKRSTLSVLREELGLSSLKPGCSPQGICGCCVVLLDDKPRLTCTLPVKAAQGKAIRTQASLDPSEAEQIAHAFVATGGAQCGYCTPGIAMQAKAIVDAHDAPTAEEIDKALGMHVCRCTGWTAIHDAVGLYARAKRENTTVAALTGPLPRSQAAVDAVLGGRPFIDDFQRPGMLFGVVVFAPAPVGKLTALDVSAAAAFPGVRCVLTASDVPGERRRGRGRADWPVLVAVGEELRCVADVVAVVAGESAEVAREAAALVRAEVAAQPAITKLEVARQDEQARVGVSERAQGDVEAALRAAAHVVDETFRTATVEPAFLEPDAAFAVPLGDGRVRVYSQGEDVMADRLGLAAIAAVPLAAVEVEQVATGASFGGKREIGVQAYAHLLALRTGCAVRVTLDMEDATRFHPKRHAFELRYRAGCSADGRIVAVDVAIDIDAGGYAAGSQEVLELAVAHALGAYDVANHRVRGVAYRTNNPVAGTMRGSGPGEVQFAMEGVVDRLAEKASLDPFAMRRQNLPTGALVELLDAARPIWDDARSAGLPAGVACAVRKTASRRVVLFLDVLAAGQVLVTTGVGEVGQGLDGLLPRLGEDLTGIPRESFTVRTRALDGLTGADGTTGLQRAMFDGCQKLNGALSLVDDDLARLVGRRFDGCYEPGAGETSASHAVQVAVLERDGRVDRITSLHDVGHLLDAVAVRGQVDGAIHMGLGVALTEELAIDDTGLPDLRFRNFGILKPRAMPATDAVFAEDGQGPGCYGSRSVGEMAMLPLAPAVASAIRAHDGGWRRALPMKDSAASIAAHKAR